MHIMFKLWWFLAPSPPSHPVVCQKMTGCWVFLCVLGVSLEVVDTQMEAHKVEKKSCGMSRHKQSSLQNHKSLSLESVFAAAVYRKSRFFANCYLCSVQASHKMNRICSYFIKPCTYEVLQLKSFYTDHC